MTKLIDGATLIVDNNSFGLSPVKLLKIHNIL